RSELFGADSAAVADVEFHRGILQLNERRPLEAKATFERVLKIRKEHLETGHRQILIAELALLQCGPIPDFTDLPIQYLTEFGGDKAGKVLALGWKILSAKKRQDYGEVLIEYQKLLEFLQAELGDYHPLMILALGDYADIAFKAGDYLKGRTAAAQAITRGRMLAPQHPQLRDALHRYGTEIHNSGEYTEAENCLREAITIGFDRPEALYDSTLTLMENLQLQGKSQAALDLSEPLVDAFEELSPYYQARLSQIESELMESSGRSDAAAQWRDRAYQAAKSIAVGSVDPIAMGRLSRILLDAEDLSAAYDFSKAALERAQEVHPQDHPRIADQMVIRSEVLYQMGQIEEGKRLAEQALRIRENKLPSEDVRLEEVRALMARFPADR
ncbi:MAG: tetratricopeptide repeat protein, partial [Planctomycetaceae bacterium]|nr:tetratricopeptide repeat protein [Planctomycetaceae bacterium]